MYDKITERKRDLDENLDFNIICIHYNYYIKIISVIYKIN